MYAQTTKDKATYSIKSYKAGEKYSAITTNDEKNYKATFHINGADKLVSNNTESNSDIEKQCTILKTYNGNIQDETCQIITPIIKANSNTTNVIGYSTSFDNHKKEVGSNESINLSSDIEYYAQTTNDDITYKVSEFEAGVGVESISSTESISCKIDKTYNGESQIDNCVITKDRLPEITTKNGYTSVGWSNTKGDTTGVNEITLSKNVDKYYANATANSYMIEYYDGSRLIGSSSHKVDEVPFNLKSSSSLNLEKTGYVFKKWAVENSNVVTYTNGQSITTNLATTAGSVVKLYAVWADEISPVCTFSSSPTLHTGEMGELTLTCVDYGSGIVEPNLTVSSFSTSSNGKITKISTPTKIDNGYKYIVTVQGTSVGNFIVNLNEGAIIDVSNNKNIITSSDDIIVKGITYTATFTKNGNGIQSIGSTTRSCTTEGENLTCQITLPETIMEDADIYTVVGWSTDSNAKTGTKIGEKVTVSTDEQFYTVTKKNGVLLRNKFNANGATLACTSSDDSTCIKDSDTYITTCSLKEAYNNDIQETSCIVTTPTITRNDFEIIGYNTDKNSDTSQLLSSSSLELTNENKNQTYYAITKKEVKIRWNANEHTVNSTQSFCTILNNNSTCTITTPTIVREGYVILGWYDESGNKFAGPGVSKEVSESAEYIATSRVPNSTEVSYDSTNSNLTDESGNKCTDVQCVIDALARITSN